MAAEGFTWRTESDTPAPSRWTVVGDALTADAALKRVRQREFLLYEGDFHNAKQLVAAMGRRLMRPRAPTTPLEAFRAERQARALEHETLGRVLVELDGRYRLSKLKRAPDVAQACRWAWGPAPGTTLVALKTLLGVLGAAQWRAQGLAVPGLEQKLTPHYGVYAPTRSEYVELLSRVDVKGKRCFDLGTGTGVLGLVLLARGAVSVVGTDQEPRAIACARENAERCGVTPRFTLVEGTLFPPGRADLVVCNPPWVPEAPKNRVDRAVFDEGSAVLRELLAGLPQHLERGGRGLLILSNLAELLGLRAHGELEALFAERGLRCVRTHQARAKHGKARDRDDALHAVRSQEVTTLYELVPA
jgi:methylase of polypeptide subunit release factors